MLGSLGLLRYVPKCIAHFVTSITRCRGKEPPKSQLNQKQISEELPWPSCDGLIVVVGPEIGCLACPGVGEHADGKVWLAKGVSTHQGHHLPAGHGKGVSEELNGGLTVSNRIRVNLFFGCFVTKLCVSLEKRSIESENTQEWMQEIYLNTVSTSCLEFERARHCDRTRSLSKVMKTHAS